jgi:hypothetical protein
MSFNAEKYLANIERRLAETLRPEPHGGSVTRAGIFNPSDPETWAVNMELSEVAQVLRYQDQNSVWELTNIPVEEGGLRYLRLAQGRCANGD